MATKAFKAMELLNKFTHLGQIKINLPNFNCPEFSYCLVELVVNILSKMTIKLVNSFSNASY